MGQDHSGRLAGRVAIVTGGASGIGAATARLFAEEGASLVIADIDQAGGQAMADELSGNGGQALFVPTNMGVTGEVEAMVAAAKERFGRIDVLVNNAGTGVAEAEVDTSEADYDRVMDVNVKGVFMATKFAVPVMKAGGGGSIINISSVYGIVGSPGFAAYHASKGAVRTLTKSTALAHAANGIRANSIHPGVVDTPLLRAVIDAAPDPAAVEKQFRDIQPIGRLGRPEEIAQGCLFLASDASSFMLGSELVIDGGCVAR